jgi:membrane associated rhomboid family serine protease
MTVVNSRQSVLLNTTVPTLRATMQLQPYSLIPPAIKTLILINVAVLAIEVLFLSNIPFQGLTAERWFTYYFSLMPSDSSMFYPYWQLITYQFMHDGFMHLFFNMLALWMFGSELEQVWGSRKFIIFYLISGIGAGILHTIIGSDIPTVGASGSIMGILVGFAMMFPNRPIYMFPFFIPIKAKYFVMIYAAIDLFSGMSSTGSGIAHFAHLGGAITGFLLMQFGDRIGLFKSVERLTNTFNERSSQSSFSFPSGEKKPAQYREPTRYIPSDNDNRHKMSHIGTFFINGERVTQEMVDAILDKIASSGYSSLTDRERTILDEVSRRIG